jgi:hypothetical protein
MTWSHNPAQFSGSMEGESGPSAGVFQIDPAEHRGEFGAGPFDMSRTRCGPAEGPAFKPLDPGITKPSFLWRYTNSA